MDYLPGSKTVDHLSVPEDWVENQCKSDRNTRLQTDYWVKNEIKKDLTLHTCVKHAIILHEETGMAMQEGGDTCSPVSMRMRRCGHGDSPVTPIGMWPLPHSNTLGPSQTHISNLQVSGQQK